MRNREEEEKRAHVKDKNPHNKFIIKTFDQLPRRSLKDEKIFQKCVKYKVHYKTGKKLKFII